MVIIPIWTHDYVGIKKKGLQLILPALFIMKGDSGYFVEDIVPNSKSNMPTTFSSPTFFLTLCDDPEYRIVITS